MLASSSTTLPMTFVPLAYGAILLFTPRWHSLCAFIFSSKATVLLRPWAWRVWIDMISSGVLQDEVILLLLHRASFDDSLLLSTSHWVSHSQRFTMSLNVQAGLCFPLAHLPLLSSWRVFLRGISGYMARKSSSKVVRTLDLKPGSWDPEPGSWNPEPRGGRAAVFLALGQEPKEKGGSPVTSYWLSGMTAVFPGTPRLAPPAFGVCQSCKPGRKMLCLPEDLFSFLYVAEL
ncbi:hypothetical protein HID58_048410 [Brassica napus]|uniref:Uncharacterized protein n=1 Tax=Brassica napus TaxID=3708 RepID=A0ABQ8B239_BRANA|nr:hypothetical protein HID58_048410 [Brassica napus]